MTLSHSRHLLFNASSKPSHLILSEDSLFDLLVEHLKNKKQFPWKNLLLISVSFERLKKKIIRNSAKH